MSSPSLSPPSPRYALEVLHLKGDERAMGESHGEHFRQRIRDFVDMRMDALVVYLGERGISQIKPIEAIAGESLFAYDAWHPAGAEEHRGVAAGAGVDATRLFLVTQMTDMRDALLLAAAKGPQWKAAEPEGCSAVLVPHTHVDGSTALVGQTWDLNPGDLDFVVAMYRRPRQGLRTWSVTCTGCPSLMGINEAGVAVGTTNIKTYGAHPGVGYLAVLHRAIQARHAAEAIAWVREAPVAAAHTYWVADAKLQVELERSPSGSVNSAEGSGNTPLGRVELARLPGRSVERNAERGPLARTNHCLASANIAIEGEAPSASSRKRLQRLQQRLDQGEITVASLRELFADRSDGVDSINRYPEDDQGTATNAVFIAQPSESRAWACRGPADRGEWIDLQFD